MNDQPRIKQLRVRTVRTPMQEPHRTASGVVAESPLVLIDVVTNQGIEGHAIVFTYTPAALKPVAELVKNIEPLILDEPLAPVEIVGAGALARTVTKPRATRSPG